MPVLKVKHDGEFIEVQAALVPHTHTAEEVGAISVENAALTGTPTAPTATAGTNNTQIATTEFVQTAINNSIANAIGGSY